MVQMTLPKCDVRNSETGCCPKFDPEPWDDEEFRFDDWPFVRATTISFMHIPLNIGRVFTRTFARIMEAEAAPTETYLTLSTDPSPWRSEHYFLVTRDVPGLEMTRLSGNFLTKVFEGPYRLAGQWAAEMEQHTASISRPLQKLYFFYTTCPKCARHYGKNYLVAFAQV